MNRFCSADLRENVVIQAVTAARNSVGVVTNTYTDVATVRAAVSSVSGKDFYEAASRQLQDVMTFTIRWYEGLTPEHRIKWAGTSYQILEINLLGVRRDFMTVKARAVKGAATNAV